MCIHTHKCIYLYICVCDSVIKRAAFFNPKYIILPNKKLSACLKEGRGASNLYTVQQTLQI